VACYGINIKGTGATTVGNSCSPATGLLVGFVSPGESLETNVPRGLNISIELYLYLQPVGQNLPCPAFLPAVTNAQLPYMYLVGQANDVSTNEDKTVVDIDATFPGVNQNIAQQLSMSPACQAAAVPPLQGPSPYRSSSDVQLVSGTGFQVSGHAGGASPGATILTGTNLKVIIK
jgi:hypothetical protein